MDSVGHLHRRPAPSGAMGAGHASSPVPAPAPVNADAQLAKYQSQLSDWVQCPSGKTPEGKAKIAELTDKIQSLKSQMKQADEVQRTPPAASAPPQGPEPERPATRSGLRLDAQGIFIDLQS